MLHAGKKKRWSPLPPLNEALIDIHGNMYIVGTHRVHTGGTHRGYTQGVHTGVHTGGHTGLV